MDNPKYPDTWKMPAGSVKLLFANKTTPIWPFYQRFSRGLIRIRRWNKGKKGKVRLEIYQRFADRSLNRVRQAQERNHLSERDAFAAHSWILEKLAFYYDLEKYEETTSHQEAERLYHEALTLAFQSEYGEVIHSTLKSLAQFYYFDDPERAARYLQRSLAYETAQWPYELEMTLYSLMRLLGQYESVAQAWVYADWLVALRPHHLDYLAERYRFESTWDSPSVLAVAKPDKITSAEVAFHALAATMALKQTRRKRKLIEAGLRLAEQEGHKELKEAFQKEENMPPVPWPRMSGPTDLEDSPSPVR